MLITKEKQMTFKKRILSRCMVTMFIMGMISLSACGKTEVGSSSVESTDRIQNADVPKKDTQDPDVQSETSVVVPVPSNKPGLNVAVIDAKRANITVHANGEEYFGYSLQMFDPGLGDIGSGNYYNVTFDNPDGSGYTCNLTGYRDWNVDYIAPENVTFEDYGQGDYLFSVTLPDDDNISFYTIDTYRLNVRTSENDTTFYSAGDFSYSDVCQFMDEAAANAAREGSTGAGISASTGINGQLSQSDAERISNVLKSYAGYYRNADSKSLAITGDYLTFQIGVFMGDVFGDRTEIHLFSDKDDLGDDFYRMNASIDANDVVTIEIVGREELGSAGKSVILVFDGDAVTMTSGSTSVTLTKADKYGD